MKTETVRTTVSALGRLGDPCRNAVAAIRISCLSFRAATLDG